ncbi:hypothetical protein VD0002_g8671 [Verticillium dahliae]|uniref:Uncharacterized protein n=2 Tax=Verticillium TaxID=1036719 RepID=A0A2J8CS57_VERDA|nr:hypothetical protein VD0004_g9896 [Verticillium dahliae]PNH39847.1 hypothetical protein VD0003_g10154 [Verticillium dahliae]PNH58868.1 hypothetical protein VD0002_g8671 [Verticillium dahliae]PNH60302.1 hypothetical protein VD0001_g9866 [Verticillium dahliae]RXG49691.1 hypothetical protein VDGE_00342 [Verticillium dahliae]
MRLAAVVLVLPLAVLPGPASATRAADPVALVRRGFKGWNATTTSVASNPPPAQTDTGSSKVATSHVLSDLTSSQADSSIVTEANSAHDSSSTQPQGYADLPEDPVSPAQTRTLAMPPEHSHDALTKPLPPGQPHPRPLSSFRPKYSNTTTRLEQSAPSPTVDNSADGSFKIAITSAPFSAGPLSHAPEPSGSPEQSASPRRRLRPPVFASLNLTSTTTNLVYSSDLQSSTETADDCSAPASDSKPTTYLIVFTATTTFFGDPADYVPPFPTIETPVACVSPTQAPPYPEEEAGEPGFGEEGPGLGENKNEQPMLTTFCFTSLDWVACATDVIRPPEAISVPGNKEPGTVTFITTDKNPAVVFSPMTTPDYGKDTKNPLAGDHHPADDTRPQRPRPADPDGPKDLPHIVKQPAAITFPVTLEPTRVIIGNQTFSLLPTQTTTVTVSGEPFEINPDHVIGGGSTIERPWNGGDGSGFWIGPGGNAGSEAVRSGGPPGITGGHGPNGVPLPPAATIIHAATAQAVETEHVVVGGQMITAIGSTVVVIHETTITYGPGIAVRTEDVDGGTVTIGPNGVVVDGHTIGGPSAGPKQTAYEIVGGVTITQVGASIVVIEDSTWTIGPNAHTTYTTEIRGETITIAPEGVTVDSLSFTYPFGPTVVTSIKATPTATLTDPSASQTQRSTNNGVSNGGTGNGDDGDEGGGIGSHEALGGALYNLIFCMLFGVWNVIGYVL